MLGLSAAQSVWSAPHPDCNLHAFPPVQPWHRGGPDSSGRVEWGRAQFRPMASDVSALSSIVAKGHQVMPTFPPPPRFIPYGEFSRIKCGAPHFMRYVAKAKM